MLNTLKDLEHDRHVCEQLVAECVHKGWPLMLGHRAMRLYLEQEGVPVPKDLLAWVSGGVMSDSHITNWAHPKGGF